MLLVVTLLVDVTVSVNTLLCYMSVRSSVSVCGCMRMHTVTHKQ